METTASRGPCSTRPSPGERHPARFDEISFPAAATRFVLAAALDVSPDARAGADTSRERSHVTDLEQVTAVPPTE